MPGNDRFPGPYAKDSVGLELYDLRRDPGEHYNVIELYPDVVKDIMVLVEQAREDLGDDLTKNEGINRRESGRVAE